MSRLVFAIGASLLFASCASTTRIYTSPAGAELTLDDKKMLGKSPVEYTETVWIWTKHRVTATLADHKEQSITIRNSGMQGAGFAACACTVGMLLPFMFISNYQPQYLIELQPIETKPTEQKPVAFKTTIDFK